MGDQKRVYKRADGSIVYYSDSDISLESGKERKLHKQGLLSKILAILFIIFQSLLLIMGIAIMAIGIMVWKRLHDSHLDTDPALKSLPLYLIGGGVAIMAIAIIAIVAAGSRKRTLGFFYIVIVILLVAAQIYAIVSLRKLEGHAKDYFSRKWDSMQPVTRLGVQTWRNCCGFEGEEDRAQIPCPENVTQGCWLQVSPKINQLQQALTKLLYGSISGHIALIIIMLIILFL